MTEPTSGRPDTSSMAAVHIIFRSSLAAGPALVKSAVGNDDRRALIASFFANVLAFLEVHHDGEEELLFPLLVERVPEQRRDLDLATEQHRELVALIAKVKTLAAVWKTKGDAEAPDLVCALQSLEQVLSVHLDYEEKAIVPLAAEYASAQEWGRLPGHSMAHFKGDKIWLILGLIRENLTPAKRLSMLERMPAPARQMWEATGEASFDAMIAEIRQDRNLRVPA